MNEQTSWDILDAYVKENSIASNQIDSFNDFVQFGMQEIVDQESTITEGTYTVKFGQISLAPPQVIEEDRTMHSSFPNDARMRDLNYDSAIHLDITEIFEIDGKKEKRVHVKEVIGRMPVMLRSEICNLSKLSKDEQIKKGECPNDPGGYFIIKGNERVLVGQMRAVYNQVFVIPQKPESKHKYIAQTRSMSGETGHSVLVQAMIGWDDRTISFSIPYIKEKVPVGVVFKALGFVDEDEIVGLISLDHPGARKYMRFILRDSFFCQTKEDALSYISQFAMHIISEDRKESYSWQVIETELLPHLGITGTVKEQACYLANIVRKLLSTVLGIRVPLLEDGKKDPLGINEDDRDSYQNKRVEVAGQLLYELFRNLFKKFSQYIKTQLEKKKQLPDIIAIISRNKNITKGLHQCMATGNWNVQKNATYVRTGVCQILDRMTYAAMISHLRRVIIPTGKEGKNTAIRQLHGSSIFFIDPSETPEGSKVGTVLNLAFTAKITRRIPTVIVRQILEKIKSIVSVEEMEITEMKDNSPVFLNGIVVGFTSEPEDTVDEIRSFRQRGILDREVSVSYDIIDNEIKIFCDEGRFCRPLLTVTDDQVNIKPGKKYRWSSLVKKDYIRYVDASEIEGSVIAMYPRMLAEQKSDYCEIHPCLMLGVVAGVIPYPDHTQSPRVCYQSSMGKQALGMPMLSYNVRADTLLHVLHYAQRSLVSTKIGDLLNIHEMPSGINAIVAIACYSGFKMVEPVW